MKYFIFTDIHGFYDLFEKQLKEVGFDKDNPEHIFVSLGDLLDRGDKPKECLQFVNSLSKDRKILIRGNHEDLIEELISRRAVLTHDIHNGTMNTCLKLVPFAIYNEDFWEQLEADKDLNQYLASVKDYAEVADNIFVHGWIPCKANDSIKYHAKNKVYEFDENWKTGDWKYARWINGMDAWSQGAFIEGKTIFCGHWHTSWGHNKFHNYGEEFLDTVETFYFDEKLGRTCPFACFDPFIDDGIIALDACTAYSGKMNCYVLEV